MTLNQIQLAIYRRTNYADTPATDVITRILQWINIWQQRILAKPGMENLRDTMLTFASVAAQTTYAMPQGLTRIEGMFEQTTPRTLTERDLSWIRAVDPQLLATGVPEIYAQLSLTQVALNPSTKGIWVVSTSVADTTQIAHIEGLRTGGYRTGDVSATLSGLTRVALGTFTDFIELDKAYITATGAGVISFYDAAAAGNELVRISIGQTSAKYMTVQLWPTPTTAITYSVDCKRVLEDLAVATDVPSLPTEFHWLLVEACCYEEWLRKDDSRAPSARKALDDGINDLRNWTSNGPDYRPRMGDANGERPSRLGGQYPAWGWRY